MSRISDGGPAFPVPGLSNLPNGDFIYPEPGMPLRDYFAAKALPEHMRGLSNWASGSPEEWHAEVSRLAYMTADAMLKARSQS